MVERCPEIEFMSVTANTTQSFGEDADPSFLAMLQSDEMVVHLYLGGAATSVQMQAYFNGGWVDYEDLKNNPATDNGFYYIRSVPFSDFRIVAVSAGNTVTVVVGGYITP